MSHPIVTAGLDGGVDPLWLALGARGVSSDGTGPWDAPSDAVSRTARRRGSTMRRSPLVLLLLVASLALTACLGDDAGSILDDPVTPEQALERPDGLVAVRGFLIDDGGGARICGAIAESYPPQCGGASLPVRGVTVANLEGATVEGTVSWVELAVVEGSLRSGAIDASTARAEG